MKECRSSSAACGGASYGKWLRCIRLSILVCFFLSQNPTSVKLFPYVKHYTSKRLPAGGKVLERRYHLGEPRPVSWAWEMGTSPEPRILVIFQELYHVLLPEIPGLPMVLACAPKLPYVPDPRGAELPAGVVFSACCSKWMSRGYEKATCYEAASPEYMGLEMVSGVAIYILS